MLIVDINDYVLLILISTLTVKQNNLRNLAIKPIQLDRSKFETCPYVSIMHFSSRCCAFMNST